MGSLHQLKIPFLSVLFFFLCFYVFSKIFGPIPFYIQSVTTDKQDLFTVDGTGNATVVPETAQISLGVSKTTATVQDAQKQVNEIANKLTSDLKALGIADKDIKTTNYSSYPLYGPILPMSAQSGDETSGSVQSGETAAGPVTSDIAMPMRPPSSQGYTVTEDINVTSKSTDIANKVLDLAPKDGANVIGGIQFVLTDEEQQALESQARTQAIQNAKQKAQSIASEAGLRLGKLVNIQESPSGYPGPIMYSAAKTAPDQNSQTSVNPGQNSITVTVTLSYETL